MKIQLSDLSVQKLGPGTYFDTRTPAFGLRVGKHRKTWIVTKGKERSVITLGHYPSLSLADARRKAMVTIGSPTGPRIALSYPEALWAFLAQDKWKESTKKELARTLRVHFTWRKPLDKITHEDVAAALDAIKAPSARRHAYVNLRSFFNWCIPRYLSASPLVGYTPPPHNTRDRVLTDDELRRIWVLAQHFAYPFGRIIMLLILTGQRRGEIAGLRKEWIDLEKNRITFPGSVTKNGREHTIPLGKEAKSILQSVLRRTPHSPRLFEFNAWSKTKAYFDFHCEHAGAPWTLHDLRRTFATNLAALGTPIHVTEKILNHVSGTTGGLVGVYQKHEWWPEQIEAIRRWEERLAQIVR